MSILSAGKPGGLLSRALVATCFLLLILGSPPVAAAWYQQQRDIMGTRVSIELWHGEASAAADCSEKAFAEMSRIDALMSPYRNTSEISNINTNAAKAAVEISDEMVHLLNRSNYFSEISNGAFDITYASIGHFYDYRKRQHPSDQSVVSALPAIDYRHIELNGNKIHFQNSGVRIDLGGIAKGYAVDRAAEVIRLAELPRL